MRRPFRGDMPVLLTLPLHFDLRLRGRDRRWRRVAIGVLIALGVALLAAGFLLPARAGGESPSAALAALSIGDELELPTLSGSPQAYRASAEACTTEVQNPPRGGC